MAALLRCALLLSGLAVALPVSFSDQPAPASVPRLWDDEPIKELELPLPRPQFSLRQVSSDYYYQIPVRPIFRSYPVYARDREPAGYLEQLAAMEPVQMFDATRLKTEQDWIGAGEMVFDAPVAMDTIYSVADVRHPDFVARTGVPVLADGSIPFVRYVVREKGKVELGAFACAMCHTRVMPDELVIKGAQGNFPGDRVNAFNYRRRAESDREGTDVAMRHDARALFQVPWADAGSLRERWFAAPMEEHLEAYDAIPPGVLARHRSSIFSPPQLPDLIGIEHRRYLDRSGLQRHRSIVDLMRYAALNQGADDLGSYAGFIPLAPDFKTPLEPATQERYSDEQLYALARYLYSQKPPPNPNRRDAMAEQGEQVFRAQGCGSCHTPPYYTNNKLLPAPGFEVPPEHRRIYDVLDVRIGTDPTLTMETRRGSGYYKVPSLLGVWYRGPFEHNGSVATLEDWFDPKRLQADYVPTGWTYPPGRPRAVPGHEFGLRLAPDDKRALIAFLRTL